MKKSIKYLVVAISLFLIHSCSPDEDEIVVVSEESVKDRSDEIVRLINIHRESIGLSSLEKNETAKQIAIDHTNYLISVEDLNHDNFSERSSMLRSEENATSTGENVARFSIDAESLVEGWLNSTGHRENIEANFTHTGVAAIRDSNGGYYYTQIFYR